MIVCDMCVCAYIRTYIHTCIHTCNRLAPPQRAVVSQSTLCCRCSAIVTWAQAYIHTCMHAYIHTYTHTDIHTYIHTHTPVIVLLRRNGSWFPRELCAVDVAPLSHGHKFTYIHTCIHVSCSTYMHTHL